MALKLTHVRLPEDEYDEARDTAKAKGISLGEYIRRALATQLASDRATRTQRREARDHERPPD